MKYSQIYMTAVIALIFVTGITAPVEAETITLTGTVRDFYDTHPDFEDGISGVVTGIVASTLGTDGKPVYDGCGGTNCGMTHGQENFDQWYRNIRDINLSNPLTIVLDNTITSDPTVYTFSSNAFFPIDNQLFGNQGRSHNYHFTFELHARFTYQGGETFSFTGDDDLWVFINDQLAVDIGGVHSAASGSVDLDTLGLIIGETYNFDLFFAERHTTESNFRIDTSIILEPTNIDTGINIHPESYPNPLNVCTHSQKASTPVLIWGQEGLDVSRIVLSTLRLGDAEIKIVGKGLQCSFSDRGSFDSESVGTSCDSNLFPCDGINPIQDGFLDLTCHFYTAGIGRTYADEEVTVMVKGEVCDQDLEDDGSCLGATTPFEGQDIAKIGKKCLSQ
ncbi:fibro-slime domain-containing protein [Nitrosococcus wardiae]|uniref:Fibro-slime domain-containing protein n=1 Tax=Nitrosococcus wardiae TaxID=1814290 RepID=A0A4P7BZX0_9GAMM|nr:fibro-slime domain-containing protein [Nitrosococcus wardiae]QBQ54744.1 fibro-slime domain-containing protein [Nitrosococcus wardiae]